MAVIQFTDDRDDESAFHVEIHDEWILAEIENQSGEELERHTIPREQVERVIGHQSGDDLEFAD